MAATPGVPLSMVNCSLSADVFWSVKPMLAVVVWALSKMIWVRPSSIGVILKAMLPVSQRWMKLKASLVSKHWSGWPDAEVPLKYRPDDNPDAELRWGRVGPDRASHWKAPGPASSIMPTEVEAWV